MHPAQEYVICRNMKHDKVPIFNRPVYLEDKKKIGVVDEVFGPINEFVSFIFYLKICLSNC
jgi:H/ACA ribonucleoprotein complex subunit 1